DAGLHITAAGAVTIRTTEELEIEASDDAGYKAVLTATAKGKAIENASGAVTIKAGGPVSIRAGSYPYLPPSGYAGYEASLNAGGASAQATLTADTGVHITTPGNINIKSGTYTYLQGYEGAGSGAKVKTTAGGTATETVTSALTLTAGGSISA